MRVLVPVEDPLFGACVVDFIKQHHWPAKTEFLVVHVIEPCLLDHSSHITFAPLLEACDEQIIARAATLVNGVAQAINNANPQATVAQEVVQAHVLEQITRMVQKWQADLVIIGSHGRRGFSHFVLGSVSLSLASELKTPIILVKPDAAFLKNWESLDFPTLANQSFDEALAKLESSRREQKILIALGETDVSEDVVEFCTRHDWSQDAEFKLLSAVEKDRFQLLPEKGKKELNGKIVEQRRERLEKLARALSGELKTSRVSIAVEKGDPRQLILRAAKSWNAELLIVGCHFSNAIGRFFLGSVALSVLCAAPCSVLLIKERLVTAPSSVDDSELAGAAI